MVPRRYSVVCPSDNEHHSTEGSPCPRASHSPHHHVHYWAHQGSIRYSYPF